MYEQLDSRDDFAIKTDPFLHSPIIEYLQHARQVANIDKNKIPPNVILVTPGPVHVQNTLTVKHKAPEL